MSEKPRELTGGESSALSALKLISKMHSELWDNVEGMLYEFRDSLGVRISTDGPENMYNGYVTLFGHDAIRMRKSYDTPEGAEAYVQDYINHIKRLRVNR